MAAHVNPLACMYMWLQVKEQQTEAGLLSRSMLVLVVRFVLPLVCCVLLPATWGDLIL